MKTVRLLSAALVAVSFGTFDAAAQSLRGNAGPAELPPSSFTGAQFVDSSGCAYIRAGRGDRATWVPRVTRDRKLLCGFRPIFGGAQAAATPAPKRDVTVAATPKPKRVVRRIAKPAPVATTIKTASVKPVKRPRVAVASSSTTRYGPAGANRRIAQSKIPVAKGFAPAWNDGRLNPMRGVGTTQGKAQMALVWSNTVPRYLIDPATGKRVK
jgi:hypothetical protein